LLPAARRYGYEAVLTEAVPMMVKKGVS